MVSLRRLSGPGLGRRFALGTLSALVALAAVGCADDNQPADEADPEPSSGDEVVAQLCDLDSWADRFEDRGLTATGVDLDPRQESFSCSIDVDADLTEQFGTEVRLRLDLYGRRTEFGADYRTATESGTGFCDALIEKGEDLSPGPNQEDFLSDTPTEDGTGVCLSDFRETGEAWTAADDWFFYLVLIPEGDSRELFRQEGGAEIAAAVRELFADDMVPLVAACDC